VYVKGFPIELDALIVERTSSPIQGAAAYRAGDVRAVVEIRKHGFYLKKREAGRKISEYFARLRDSGGFKSHRTHDHFCLGQMV
jgi:hypothetical protein